MSVHPDSLSPIQPTLARRGTSNTSTTTSTVKTGQTLTDMSCGVKGVELSSEHAGDEEVRGGVPNKQQQ